MEPVAPDDETPVEPLPAADSADDGAALEADAPLAADLPLEPAAAPVDEALPGAELPPPDPLALAPKAAVLGCGLSFMLGLAAVVVGLGICVALYGEDTIRDATTLILCSFLAQPMFVVAAAAGAAAYRIPLRLALALQPVSLRVVLLAVVGLLGAGFVGDWLAALVQRLIHHPGSLDLIHDGLVNAPPALRWTLLGIIAVAPALGEEALFRGVIYTGLRRYGATRAIVVSSVLFACSHGDGVQGVVALVLGLYLGLLRERTGSLYPGVAAHLVTNVLGCAMMLHASPDDAAPTAGVSGPSLLLVPAGLVVALACLRALRRRDS